MALSEMVVHGDDMFQPLDRRMTIDLETAWATLGRIRMIDRLVPGFAFRGRSHRGLRLVATDVAWSSGRGSEVSGSALDLLALLTNRAGAVEHLWGPGVARLAGS